MDKRLAERGIEESIIKYIDEVSKHYEVEAIIVFGSYAKGTNNEDKHKRNVLRAGSGTAKAAPQNTNETFPSACGNCAHCLHTYIPQN